MSEFIRRLNEIGKQKDVDFWTYVQNFVLSTLWLTYPYQKLQKNKWLLFVNKIIDLFKMKKYFSISITYIIADENLKKDINYIFQEFGIQPIYFCNFLDGKNYIDDLTDNFLKKIISKNETLHKNLVIIIAKFSLLNSDSKSSFGIELLKKYKIDLDEENMDYCVSLARSLLTSEYSIYGKGYVVGEALIMDLYNERKLKNIIKQKLNFCTKIDDFIFSKCNILTGNGFSKYLTFKHTNDDWLIKTNNFSNLQKLTFERLEQYQYELNSQTHLYQNKFYNQKIKLNIDDMKEYVLSSKFISDIISHIDLFAIIQGKFIADLSHNKVPHHVNDYVFFDYINELAKKNKITFFHKNRNYLFHSLLNFFPNDLFWNIECLLMVIDKFLLPPNEKMLSNDYFFVQNHMIQEAYIENIWNLGKNPVI